MDVESLSVQCKKNYWSAVRYSMGKTYKQVYRKNTYALKCEHGLYQRYGPM